MSPSGSLTHLLLLALCALAASPAHDGPTLESVVGNPRLWPREITLTAPVQIPIMIAGKASGSMSLPTGRVLPVKTIKPSGVEVVAMGANLVVPASQTDVLSRSSAIASQIQDPSQSSPTAPLGQATSAPGGSPPKITNKIALGVGNDLVSLHGPGLNKFDGGQLTHKKYLAVYFSAGWCPPCRQFSPELVAWYNNVKPRHPEFDLIFFSCDHSEDEMLAYMKADNMPWPAVDYHKLGLHRDLHRYSGDGIPDLVVLDQDGKVVSDSFQGQEYLGPHKVLRDLDQLLKGS